MKKAIFILVIVFTSLSSKAQKDYSKEIIRTVDDLKNTIEYTTPYPNGTFAGVSKLIKPNEASFTRVIFHLKGIVTNYNAKGIYVKFENGKILRYPDAEVACVYSAYDDRAVFIGAINIDSENYEDFTSSKVIEFALDNNKDTLGKRWAERLMSYVKYIYTAK